MGDNVKLLKNIFGSMEYSIFLGDPLKEGRFACFMQPGEFVPIDIKENDSSKDMFLQASFCNKVIDTSIVNRYDKVGFGGNKELLGSIEDIYGHVLSRNSVPQKDLSSGDKSKAESLREDLEKKQPKYDFYKLEVEKLNLAILTERQSQNPSQPVLQDLRSKLKQAEKNWIVFGYKREYENSYAQFMRIMRINPQMHMQELSDNLAQHERVDIDGNKYYQTFLSIPISSWDSVKWNSFETQVAEKDEYNYSKSTNWSGGASGRWGLWSAGGGASGSTQYNHEKSSATTIKIKFEYIVVRILRDWLDETIFQERFWTWNRLFGGQLISDGGNIGAEPPIRPKGSMPVLVNQLVIVKNVEISGDFSESEMTFYREEIKKNVSAGWGPFSVSGSYKSVTEEKREVGSIGSNIIKINHPQIIAKIGILLPSCPNPDPKLSFDRSDAWFPEDGFNSEFSAIYESGLKIDEYTLDQESATIDAYKAANKLLNTELDKIEADKHEKIHKE